MVTPTFVGDSDEIVLQKKKYRMSEVDQSKNEIIMYQLYILKT